MRLRTSCRRALALALLACVALCLTTANISIAQTVESGPTSADIDAAVAKLKADPNLSQERKTSALRWKTDNKQRPREPSGLGAWFLNFFVWLSQLSRVLMWVIGGMLAIALLVLLYRLFRTIQPRELVAKNLLPTHVRDLDIRPESLPDDVGAAALALWQGGEHRAALALLYRGLLSRLAHVHQVPIRDSTTEGDCLALAVQHLPAHRTEYVTRLVRLWQRATYGGRDAQNDEVEFLCADFAEALAPAANASQPS